MVTLFKHTIIPAGGLGNRIRVILSALQWQHDTGNKVRILWAQDKGLASSFDRLFKPIPELKEVKNLRWFKILRKIYLHSPLRFIYAYNYNECDKLNSWLENPKGILYSSSYSNFYNGDRPNYHEVFKLNDSVQQRLDKILKDINSQTIGIHIRRTDNVDSIENSPLYVFSDYVSNVIKEDKKVKFYLATDDIDVKKDFIEQFGDRIITLDCPLRRDTEDGIIYAILELYTLASCSKIVGSYYSSFSELAAQIGDIRLEILKKN